MSKSRQPGLSDDDVESLLTEFFRHEMPVELRSASFDSRRQSAKSVVSGPSQTASRGTPAIVGTVVAACALLLAVTVLSPSNTSDSGTKNAAKPSGGLLADVKTERQSTSPKNADVVNSNANRKPVALYLPVELLWGRDSFGGAAMLVYFDEVQRSADGPNWNLQFNIELFRFPESGKRPDKEER